MGFMLSTWGTSSYLHRARFVFRPNKETVLRLLAEVRCIQDTMCVLRQRVCEAHALLQTPAQNKSVLEEEQQSKAQALHIDQHSCTELHKTCTNILQLLGHTQLTKPRDTLT
ncbi:hypothetical protein SRHO_G00187260 [Serrasalmus rhombeus]